MGGLSRGGVVEKFLPVASGQDGNLEVDTRLLGGGNDGQVGIGIHNHVGRVVPVLFMANAIGVTATVPNAILSLTYPALIPTAGAAFPHPMAPAADEVTP